jgi:Family of unknown function (DUF6886)
VVRLFHVSEEKGIARFEPHEPPSMDAGVTGKVVWAIDEDHLPNYLLPRDCPRVTFRASERTSADDRARFIAPSRALRIIAVESGWLERIKSCRLFAYELPADTFELADASAGYWISRTAVVPTNVVEIADPLAEMERHRGELRALPDLWPLRDAVVASTLDFSIIRMRNARPRAARQES